MGPFQGAFSRTFMEEWRGYSYHISVFLPLSKHSFWTTRRHTCTGARKNTHRHFLRWPKWASQVSFSSQRFPPSSTNRQDPVTRAWLSSLTEAAVRHIFPEDMHSFGTKTNKQRKKRREQSLKRIRNKMVAARKRVHPKPVSLGRWANWSRAKWSVEISLRH